MDSNTFLIILYVCLAIIVIGHVWLKGLMGESIRRKHSSDNNKTENDDNNQRAEMLNYVTGHLKDLNRNKYVFNPKGANFFNDHYNDKQSQLDNSYPSAFHDSDIHSQQTNLSKYFEIEQSVPDTKKLLLELQCKDETKNCMGEIKSKLIDQQTGNPLFFDQGSDGSLAYQPDIWKYQDERVMNGGSLDGIKPLDNDRSDYAIYPPNDANNDANFIHSYPYTVSSGMF